MHRTVRLAAAGTTVLLISAFAIACGADEGTGVDLRPDLAVGDFNNDNSGDVAAGVVNLCAFRPHPDTYGPASFSASAPAGEDVLGGVFDLGPVPTCVEIWNVTPGNTSLVEVAATLESTPAGLQLDRIYARTNGGQDEFFLNTTTASVDVSDVVGGLIWFKFELADTPPNGGGAGCTPGFWRQPRHFQYWEGYSPSDSFAAVFGVARAGTLLQNVTANGGGANALARHAVAALLNASSSEVSYDFTTADVIGLVQSAFASGNFEAAKNLLEVFNEQGCTVDKSN